MNGFLFASFGESPSTVVSTCCKNPKPSIRLCCSTITGKQYFQESGFKWSILQSIEPFRGWPEICKSYNRHTIEDRLSCRGFSLKWITCPLLSILINGCISDARLYNTHPQNRHQHHQSVSVTLLSTIQIATKNLLPITPCDLMVCFYASGIKAERQGI
jgi:hypothetical protein